MKRKIIDVSTHQGKIDWEKVKPQIDGAILRCGYGGNLESQDDKQFKRNADECTRLGIPFGVYIYSYAKTVENAKSEAEHVLRLIKGYKLSYPVYLDLEEDGTIPGIVERANAFGDIIEAAGYWCGVYSSLYWWNTHLKGLERFTKWVAQWNKTCDYKGSNLDLWQYSDKGNIDGISGAVDMNECYRDFPAEILGSAKPADKEEPKEEPAAKLEEDGLWGTATTTRLQQIFGTTVDGVVSNQLWKYQYDNPGLKSGWEWTTGPLGNGSQLIKAMQKWAGMPAHERDGLIGPKTIKAFQKKLGTYQDGCVSNPSQMVKALQKWANAQ